MSTPRQWLESILDSEVIMSKNYFFHSLSIENFRGITRLSIPSLRRINIIGGVNGVGKSTVLEAILLMLARSNPLILSRPYLKRQMKMPYPDGFTYLFNEFDTKK